MEVQGLPPPRLVESGTRRKMFFDSLGAPRVVPNSRGKKRRPGTRDLAQQLRTTDVAFVEFLAGTLRWDPSQRSTPDAALTHEWITEGLAAKPAPRRRRVDRDEKRESQTTSLLPSIRKA